MDEPGRVLVAKMLPDDAWVLAAASREWRDAVRMSGGVRAGPPGVARCVERLRLARAWGCPYVHRTIARAAAVLGRTDVLEEASCPGVASVAALAAGAHQWDTVRWCADHGWRVNRRVAGYAQLHGVEVLVCGYDTTGPFLLPHVDLTADYVIHDAGQDRNNVLTSAMVALSTGAKCVRVNVEIGAPGAVHVPDFMYDVVSHWEADGATVKALHCQLPLDGDHVWSRIVCQYETLSLRLSNATATLRYSGWILPSEVNRTFSQLGARFGNHIGWAGLYAGSLRPDCLLSTNET